VVALNVEAGWLAEHDRRVAEKAWDEGHELGVADESFAGRGLSSDPDAAEHPHDNPYSPQ
jgi:hypothetical protein